MGVVSGTALTIAKVQTLLSPSVGVQPLKAMLQNANTVYRTHQPPLVSFAPMMAVGSLDSSFVVGIVPSVDTIRYQVIHLVLPTFTGNMTFTVESGRNDPTVWAAPLAGPTVQAVVNGVWFAYQQAVTIAPTEDRLRFTYSAAAGDYFVSHVLVWPDPDPALPPIVAPFAQRPSGFWPADDALLVADGPVHTEMLDRCWRNAVAMLRDRWQVVGSFVQDDGRSTVRHRAPFGTVAVGEWALVGKARCFLPYQAGAMLGLTQMRPALYVMAQASVSAGTTATRVRVVARGANGSESQALLNATGAMVTSTIYADTDASPDAGVDLEWYVRCAAGQQVSLHSAVLLWQPGA